MSETLPAIAHTPPGSREVTLDKGAMSATGIFAANSLDRVGDVLEVGGIVTDYHRRNPIALWNHGKELSIPIGVTETPEKAYTVEIDEEAGEARCTTFFSQRLLEAEQIYQLIDEGIIRAMSIGYRPLKAKRLQAQQGTIQKSGLHLEQVELLEVSYVGVPANGDAVRACLDRSQVCGKSLSPLIRQALTPLLPAKKTIVRGGFDMKAVTKADPAEETPPPSTDTPQEPEASTPKMPLGAEMLSRIHQHLLDLVEFSQTESGVLENEEVQNFLLDMADGVFEKLTAIEGLFKSQYPDLEQLPETKPQKATGDAEKPTEGDKPADDKESKEAPTDAEGKPEKEGEGKSYSGGGAKRMTKAAGGTIRECAEHLTEMANAENLTRDQKVSCKYYGKTLAEMAQEPEKEADSDDGLTPTEKAIAERKLKQLELMVTHKKRLARQKSLRIR